MTTSLVSHPGKPEDMTEGIGLANVEDSVVLAAEKGIKFLETTWVRQGN